MSPRLFKWALWAALIVAVPLPYFMIESGRVPALELILLAAATTPLAITDPSLTTRFIATLFLAQALGYGALLYLLARAAARRLATSRARTTALLVTVLMLSLLATQRVYRAPLTDGAGTPTTLPGVFRVGG